MFDQTDPLANGLSMDAAAAMENANLAVVAVVRSPPSTYVYTPHVSYPQASLAISVTVAHTGRATLADAAPLDALGL
jgi:hypothetical protein